MIGAPHAANKTTLQKRLQHLPIYELDNTSELHAQDLQQWLETNLLQELFTTLDWLKWDQEHCWHPYTQHGIDTGAVSCPLS